MSFINYSYCVYRVYNVCNDSYKKQYSTLAKSTEAHHGSEDQQKHHKFHLLSKKFTFLFQLECVPLAKDCKLLFVEVEQFSIYKQKLLVSDFIYHAWACCKRSQIKADKCTIGPYCIFIFLCWLDMKVTMFVSLAKNHNHEKNWKHYTIPDVAYSSIT